MPVRHRPLNLTQQLSKEEEHLSRIQKPHSWSENWLDEDLERHLILTNRSQTATSCMDGSVWYLIHELFTEAL